MFILYESYKLYNISLNILFFLFLFLEILKTKLTDIVSDAWIFYM